MSAPGGGSPLPIKAAQLPGFGGADVRPSLGGAGARPGRPQAETFKEHVSMTSVCPQHVRFRNCLAIQSETRSFSRGEQTFTRGVCASSSPPPPPTVAVEEEPPEEKGAPRRARVSMAAAHSGRSWFLSRILFLRSPAP